MDYLYHGKTGDVVAVFGDGKVYKDIWKRQLLGTYKYEKIYVGKGLFKEYVGNYNGDISEIRCCMDVICLNKIGYIHGDNVYSGMNDKESKKIAYFVSSDKFGAAAAALLSGMFKNSERTQE